MRNYFDSDFYLAFVEFGFQFNTKNAETYFFEIAEESNTNNVNKFKDIIRTIQKQDPEFNIQNVLNKKNSQGATVMHYLAKNRDLNSLCYLKSQGADLLCVDNEEETLIHWMMKTYSKKYEHTFLPLLLWLVENGVDCNAKNNKGVLAIQKLSRKGSLESILSSIDVFGIESFKVQNNHGKTAMDMLKIRKDQDEINPVIEKINLNSMLPLNEQNTPKKRNFHRI